MGSSAAEEKKLMEEPLLDSEPKGGCRTIPFIIANEVLAAIATTGLQPNLILYLMGEYHLEMATGSKLIFLWIAATTFTPLLGAVIADSFAGRFRVISFGCVCQILGVTALWLTVMIPQARPAPCSELNSSCSSATTFQLFLLCASFGVISIGAGSVRSSSMAFGADQLKKRDGKENVGVIKCYISWYYASWMAAMFIAFSCIAFIQEKMGWKIGFGIPVLLTFLSAASFFLASSFYIKLKAKSCLVVELIQVMVASYKKRNVKLSPSTNCQYHCKEGSVSVIPSENLRFLNRACIIIDPQQELNPEGIPTKRWSLCTVDQVEALKALIKVTPLWSTGMLMSATMTLSSFTVLQAKSMNRKIGSSFEIPAGSFSMFIFLCMALWVPLNDYIFLPIASRIMGRPARLSMMQSMGLGIFLSCVALIAKAVLETIRRNLAISEGYFDDPNAVVNMSAMWLIPSLCLTGFAEILNIISQNEFFYTELPKTMSSIASNLHGLGFSVGSLLSSVILSVVDDLTKRGGNESWVSSNINRGHYDYYFWVLACVGMVNMIIFLIFSKAHGPCKAEFKEIDDERDQSSE